MLLFDLALKENLISVTELETEECRSIFEYKCVGLLPCASVYKCVRRPGAVLVGPMPDTALSGFDGLC